MNSIHSEEELKQKLESIKGYNYEFENLAFEGGGAKMAAYVGSVKVDFTNIIIYIQLLSQIVIKTLPSHT